MQALKPSCKANSRRRRGGPEAVNEIQLSGHVSTGHEHVHLAADVETQSAHGVGEVAVELTEGLVAETAVLLGNGAPGLKLLKAFEQGGESVKEGLATLLGLLIAVLQPVGTLGVVGAVDSVVPDVVEELLDGEEERGKVVRNLITEVGHTHTGKGIEDVTNGVAEVLVAEDRVVGGGDPVEGLLEGLGGNEEAVVHHLELVSNFTEITSRLQ
ncbi:peptide ABC transporter ATP-binding protein, putative [Babesia ovata]|uniref:Peptide ABC transporter ATP-binding protein, putative n=1 Tax=Babesia ovata TaxID=189622 RepID=A0A2H6KA38_9APIC|nr:peptide ABC transporter ATP-binding protein, putative [Babesia ovata]GBE59861.1 peptide ABC transporter ATP-binding protein, putative [Babesia ovata]